MATGSGTVPGSFTTRQPQRLRHSFWWYLKWLFVLVQAAIFCLAIVTYAVGRGIYDQMSQLVPDLRYISQRNKAEPTRVFAADGSLLAEFRGEQREWVALEDLRRRKQVNGTVVIQPGNLIRATLAIEDSRFYTHPGMDAKRILGAAWANYRSGRLAQGGSTITEQLAVNIYQTRTKKLQRRLQTAMLALQLERRFSKDEILEMYLNEIYYGNRAYGCEAAARIYFNKKASQLTLGEAALIAGLPQRPSEFDALDPDRWERIKRRQRLVLREMVQAPPGLRITDAQRRQAAGEDARIRVALAAARERMLDERARVKKWRYPYFVSYVNNYLQRQYGWDEDYLQKSGLKIFTTLDPEVQDVAERVVLRQLNRLSGRGNLQGALVAIDPWTGHVLAVVGGRDYYDKKHNGMWNRAVQGKRQPGSTFKPYIYATAMEMGYSPYSRVVDRPLRIWGHTIKNYDFKHRGSMTFRDAVAISNNVAATRVLMTIGIPNVVQKAHLMGITSSLVPVPTLALGTSEVSLLEHVSAFGVFATRGLRAEPTPVERVESYAGVMEMEHTHPVRAARVLSTEAGNNMWDMLRHVVTSGTGTNASIRGVEVIGKTGTTSSNKDVWFMGATKHLVCGVWMGYDRPRELYGSSGGRWCAPVFRSFMIQALDVLSRRDPIERAVEDARATELRQRQAAQFKKYVRVRVCEESGLLANAACPRSIVKEFSSAGGATGGAPTQRCDLPGHVPDAQPVTMREDPLPARPDDLGFDDREPAVPSRRDARPARSPDYSAVPRPENDFTEPPASAEGGGEAIVHLDTNPGENPPAPVRRGGIAAPRREDPDAEVVVTVCADSGLLATGNCPVTMQHFATSGTAPRRRCNMH